MTAQHTAPVERARGYLAAARSDSLVRNSLYLMTSTVVTAGLGYVFWIIAAHVFTSAQVGIGGAVISLCSTVALLTYLGSAATLIERLHSYERSPRWTAFLVRACAATSLVTALTTAVSVPVVAHSRSYGTFFSAISPVLIAVVGAAAWTLVNLFSAAFIAARRADGLLSMQTLISMVKLMLVMPIAAARAGAVGIVGAWVASAVLGVVAGALWLLPRFGLGRAEDGSVSPQAVSDGARYSRAAIGRLAGQHLTSVGGAVTPLLLPVLVVIRLGVTPNAYFYITWMIGGVFFMVSPSVASAAFAESVRAGADLPGVVTKAVRVIALVLLPAMVVMIAGGRLILRIFGESYATAGYGLLVLLAISAVPDAVSNIAVAVFRVTDRLGYSAALNCGILVATTAGSWLLMPRLGIAGVGAAWLGAQTLGAIASWPAYRVPDLK
jgi:O-antigen/teichoic acid export membrane protein